jgi:putative phosphoribosyl transferase
MPTSTHIPSTEVAIQLGNATLGGSLTVPDQAAGLVLFAHGSGSSRHSPRNRYVAEILQRAHLGTLLMDLLTHDEELVDQSTRQYRFDIGLLSTRLTSAIDWLAANPTTRDLPIGLFGASTGAAAALRTAAARPDRVFAVVSRGGRPDLAGDALPLVTAPTLLIVGSRDTQVIALNEEAMRQMHATCEMVLVPGATHLIEEPGTLDQAANLARDWFSQYVPPITGAS